MSYNFLGLVNDVLERTNDAVLTQSNFSSADGFYSVAKDSVNNSIRFINQDQFNWPFNFIEEEEILTPGEVRYSYPSNAKMVDFHSFRIKRDDTLGNKTMRLRKMMYEEYLDRYADAEYNTATSIRDLPALVAQTPGQEFVVYPNPDKAYTLVYDYYMLPVDLILYSDVPSIPEAFRHVIADGAMFYAYQFRSDYENAQLMFNKYKDGIANMKSIYINRYEYVRDTRLARTPVYSKTLEVN